jgi:asparagine synthase (glutamine-hydrolysing)
MCGIAGYLSFNGHFSSSDLSNMTTAIKHRGPDAEGFFVDEVCGLGHRRLSILDLSEGANQPMYAQNGRYSMVFNGEVYNFREIAANLQLPLRTTSDSEVILEAFARQGAECVHLFNGMFALAIYDTQQHVLHLYRDHMGIKPIFYYWDGHSFAFASELKALLQVPAISRKIQPPAIEQFLHRGYIPAPYTIYESIYKVLPGHYVTVSSAGLHTKPYWSTNRAVHSEIITDEQQARRQLEELLLSSIRYQLVSDVPLGVLLSGGIDSSLVTALAARQWGTNLNSFSIGFKESTHNESHYAKAVATHIGTHHHEFIVSSVEAKQLVEPMLDVYDEPYADSSAIPTMLVSRLARQHVTVALCGDGGDELFFGYGMYQWANRLANPWLRNLRKPIAQLLSYRKPVRYQKAAALFNYRTEAELPSHIFSQEQGFFSNRELEFLHQHSLTPNGRGLSVEQTGRKLSAMEKQALYDLNTYLPDDLLTKVDRATMQYGLEARVPLLDYRIVEFALNLAPDLKYRNGITKYLLKEVLYQYVPKHLFNRPKQGFSIPLQAWLRTDFRYLIDDYLNQSVVDQFSIVPYEVVKQIKDRFLQGDDFVYNRLWALIVLHRWLKKYA